MKNLLLIFILCTSISASEEKEVIATLWHELGHPPIKQNSSLKKVDKVPSIFKEKSQKKELSPGQRKIEEIKARNRKLIREKKVESHASTNIYDQKREGLSRYKKIIEKTLTEQKNEIEKTRARWKESRRTFLKNIPTYKKNTFEIQSVNSKSSQKELKLLPENQSLNKGSDYYVIKNAFNINVKDQGKRPTCSAFAGASAIEILLRQSKSSISVSEQYLYWSSKPYCQKSPCSKKGSWISFAYDKSISAQGFDIPNSVDCPYNAKSEPGNETQIPLINGCRNGKVKVDRYKKVNSSIELYNSLNSNHPVIIGVKLSPNFYTTNGIITYQDSLVNGKMDQHANGHALLLIGHMKLPKKLRSEGKLCYLAVNSWTKGWGAGGYACITEKWLSKYKVANPFMALTKVRSI